MKEVERQADLLLHAEGPHIVKVLGLFTGYRPGMPKIEVGLVMELMENGTLDSLQVSLIYYYYNHINIRQFGV